MWTHLSRLLNLPFSPEMIHLVMVAVFSVVSCVISMQHLMIVCKMNCSVLSAAILQNNMHICEQFLYVVRLLQFFWAFFLTRVSLLVLGLVFCAYLYIMCFMCIFGCCEFSCLYLCSWLPGKIRVHDDLLLCVKWDIKRYSLTYCLMLICYRPWTKNCATLCWTITPAFLGGYLNLL